MKTVIGIDVGGSTTKIVGFTGDKMLTPMFVKANDPLTSAYGAFGKFLAENSMELDDIERIMTTGVGSSFLPEMIYGLPTYHKDEFSSIAKGGLYLTGLEKAIVVSMGTGTAMVRCEGESYTYLGGTGVGGGTLMGLSKSLLGLESISTISELAKDGDLSTVDLSVSAITKKELNGLSSDATASNFGNLKDTASKADMALGIINMIYETVGMMSVLCARSANIDDIILTGSLSQLPQCEPIFANLSNIVEKRFIVPKNARFATVIGAALS